jgi:hypothetical protein
VKLTKEELIDFYQPQGDRSDCPTGEELALATTDEMPEPERKRVAAHLLVCRDCAEEFSLIRPLKPFAEQAASVIRDEATEIKIVEEKTEAGVERPSWWRRFTVDLFYARLPYEAAAMLLIVSVAFSIWLVYLRREDHIIRARLEQEIAERDRQLASASDSLEEARRQLEEAIRLREKASQPSGQTEIAELRRAVEELSRPQLNIPIVNLEPQASLRGQTSEKAALIEVPSSANVFTLVLNVAGQQNHSGYALEIADQSGKIIWQGRGLRKSPYNTFTLALARRLLPAGQYRIRIYGLGAGQKQLVEDYSVQIQYN